MKIRMLTVLVVLAVLVPSTAACKSKDSFLVQVMQLAPEDAKEVGCMDIKAMVEDPDLSFAYDEVIKSLSYEIVGVDDTDISAYGIVEIDWESTIVLFGDFNLEDVRAALEEEYFVEDEYLGVEIWTDDYEDSVAFIDSMIVSGNKDSVEACIRIHENEESSLYDNEDMRAVVDKLPAAIAYRVFGPDAMYSIEVLSGSICWGNSTSGDGVLNISGWLKFDSEASAEDAMTEDLEDDLGWEFNASNVEASLSGQFIEFTGDM